MRVKENEQKQVTVSSLENFGKAIEKRARLDRHKFVFDDKFLLAFVKAAYKPDMETLETFPDGDLIYPDIVYFREWTGCYPSIDDYISEQRLTIVSEETGEPGLIFPFSTYKYDINKTAYENIFTFLKVVQSKAKLKECEDILNHAPLMMHFIKEELQLKAETPEDILEALTKFASPDSEKLYSDMYNKAVETTTAKKFINFRTKIMTQYAYRGSVNAGEIKNKSTFRSGIFDLDKEEDPQKTLNLLYSFNGLVRDTNRELFFKDNEKLKDLDFKDYKEPLNSYLFSNRTKLGDFRVPEPSGIIFALSASVVEETLELANKDDNKQGLVYYDIGKSSTKIQKIKGAMVIKNGDPELSFVPMLVTYTNRGSAGAGASKENLKKEAGKNVTFSTKPELVDCYEREEYFKLLQPAYKADSYKSCGAFNILEFSTITETLSQWMDRDEVKSIIEETFDDEKLNNYKEALIYCGYDGPLPSDEKSQDLLESLSNEIMGEEVETEEVEEVVEEETKGPVKKKVIKKKVVKKEVSQDPFADDAGDFGI